MTEEMPELISFVSPTGGRAAAQIHVSRTVCRRAERTVVALFDDGVCDPINLKYLSRLSYFFFTAARWVNYCEGIEEIEYRRVSPDSNQSTRIHIDPGLQWNNFKESLYRSENEEKKAT